MLSVVLFGSMYVSLQYPSGLRTLTFTPLLAELLAFLALGRGRSFLRTEIAESVWGHYENEVTVGCVNTALWRLRRTLEQAPGKRGDFLVTNSQGGVGLNGPQPIALDVAEFESLTRNGLSKSIEQLTDADCNGLRTGVALYRDNALADFGGEWALKERERLRNTFQSAAGRLMQVSELRREYDAAIRYARLVLAVDPLREDVHRDLMRYFVNSGQRALSLRQFEECRAALKREFAIQPMNETVALYRQIAEGAVALARGQSLLEGSVTTASRSPANRISPQVMDRRASRDADATVNPVARVQMARTLIAEADNQLNQTLKLIQR